jgi:SAM-dependent methyltransferase
VIEAGARSEDAPSVARYRRRVALFLALALAAATVLAAAAWTVTAVERVNAVEAERDSWQRPADVLQALDLGEGQVVVDLGSGVGYFALKLAERVGRRGRVLAVDVRRFPLLFLRVRAFLRGVGNLEAVHGEPDDPHLPAEAVDAVLVVNTFHELEDPERVLGRAREALRPDGRLVLVDPAPSAPGEAHAASDGDRHQPLEAAQARVRRSGFEIVRRDDSFVDGAGPGRWWLIVARRRESYPESARVRGGRP